MAKAMMWLLAMWPLKLQLFTLVAGKGQDLTGVNEVVFTFGDFAETGQTVGVSHVMACFEKIVCL